MPKFSNFGRRKSAGNVLEEIQNGSAAQDSGSFRVFERPQSAGRPLPVNARPALAREENMFDALKGNRDSGASHTNTISTADQSSRRSNTSTAPSSATDLSTHEEFRSPHDKPFTNIPPPPAARSSAAGFFLKNASRTFSFGRKPPSPTHKEENDDRDKDERHTTPDEASRKRAVTTSSYASTATPPRVDDQDFSLSLGGDFGQMFGTLGKRKSVLDMEQQRAMTESPEMLPAARATGGFTAMHRVNHPAPLNLDKTAAVDASPYSWGSNNSGDGLMGHISPPPVPAHAPPKPPKRSDTQALPSYQAPSRQTPDSGLRRSSAFAARRQSTLELGDVTDEDARLLRESMEASRHLENPRVQQGLRNSWSKPLPDVLFDGKPREYAPAPSVSPPPLPREARKVASNSSIAEAASLADRLISKPTSPDAPKRLPARVITPAQFERLRDDQGRGADSDTNDEDDADTYEDDEEDEDEAEKLRQVAKQRRKQEAHMTVYRQQMMKVTGETPRPPMPQSQSTPSLPILKADDEEEDEEVPLAILAAHGFPNKTRAPGQLQASGSHPNLRAASQPAAYPPPPGSTSGEPAGGSGRLPVFARHLPQDPYFGASLVNPSNRESLALGGGAGSLRGGVNGPPPGIPGGLVGVIANEERSRAMRRGSPNAAGEYPMIQSVGNHGMSHPGMQMPGMGMHGMGNGMPMNGTPMNGMPMNGMPMFPLMSPGDQNQMQMNQQMQQFMQMQMQFMQMMAGQPQNQRPLTPNGMPQSATMGAMAGGMSSLQQPGMQSRPMSMLDPTSQWQSSARSTMYAPSIHAPGAGYAPSIAPSERSNVGLPGRYRPVSQAPPADKSRTSTLMSGALQNWTTESKASSTIKIVSDDARKSKLSADDDDDEEGWEEMARKREKKKSAWRLKKGGGSGSGLQEMLGLAT